MIPVLFKEDEQIFSHNGIGALYESLSCDIWEIENGSFTMELEYPVDGELFSELEDYRIIQAKPNDIDEPHNFRIYEIDKSIDELTVYVRANTITNDLGSNLVTNYVGRNVTAQQAMNGMKVTLIEPTNFDLISDIQTQSSTEWTRINPLNAIVGTRGSLVDVWGGEIKRTNNAIYLYSRRGKDKVATIRPGKNIEGLTMTVSTAGIATKVLPTYTYRPTEIPKYQMVTLSDGTKEKRRVQNTGDTRIQEDITVLGDVVTSQYANNYPINHWRSVDYNDHEDLRETIDTFINDRLDEAEESSTIIDNSNFPDELKSFVKTELDKRATQYFTHRNPGVDQPTVRISVNMLQLADSPEWEEFKDLERIGLTDTVEVWVEEYDIDVDVRVTELQYDSLGERVKKFTAGSDKAPRQSVQEKQYADLTKSLNDYKTTVENGVNNIMRNTADGLNRKFEGYTEPPAELSSEGDIWFKEIGGGKVEIWIHDGVYWQPLMTEDFVREIEEGFNERFEEIDDAVKAAEQVGIDVDAAIIAAGFTSLEETILDIQRGSNDAKDNAVNALNNALEALSNAGTSLVNSQTAIDSANSALNLANDAISNASTAVTAANNAVTSANSALDAAASATTAANDAKDSADSAQTQASNLSKQVSDFDITIDGFNQTINNYEGQVASLINDISGFESTVANYETELDEYGNEVSSYATEVSTMRNTVDGFESTVATYSQEVNSLTGEVTTYATQVSEFTNTVDGLNSTVASYEVELDEYGNVVDTYTTQVSEFENTLDGFTSTVAGYRTEVLGYEGEVTLYKNQVSTLNNTVDGFNSTVANYTTQLDEYGNEVNSYATELSTMRNTVSGFESSVATYGQAVNSLTGEVATYADQVSNFSNTVDGLNSTVASYEVELDEYGNIVDTYATEVSTMRNTVNGFESTVATYGNEVSNLAGEVVGYKNQVSTLNNTVNGFNSVVTQVQYDLDNLEIGGRNLFIPNATAKSRESIIEIKNAPYSFYADTSWVGLSKRFKVDGGETITVAFWAKSTSGHDDLMTQRIGFTSETGITRTSTHSKTEYDVSETWRYFTDTFVVADNTQSMQFYARTKSENVWINGLMIVRGNKAPTDWTPAPEDTATVSQVSILENTIDGMTSTVAEYETELIGYRGDVTQYQNQVSTMQNTVDGFNSTVTQYTTEVDEYGNLVDSYATQVSTLENTVSGFQSTVTKVEQDYGEVSGTVANHITQIRNINGQIYLKANTTTVNTLTGRVTAAEAGITTNANAIKLKASQSSVDTLSGKVNDLGAQIDVTAGQISSKVWNTDIEGAIDKVQIGGRNLVLNTGSELRTVTIAQYGLSGMLRVPIDGEKISHGDNVTFSVYIQDIPEGEAVRLRLDWYREDGTYSNVTSSDPWSSEDGRYVFTATIPENTEFTEIRGRIMPRSYAGSYRIQIKEEQLERGNKATDWSPAPEDSINLISHVETELTQKHDSILARVSTNEGNITTIEANVNGIQATVADKADKSQITQLSNAINLRVTSSQLSEAILEDKKIIDDARNIGSNPSWYISNYPEQIVNEFKNNSTMGISGEGTYGVLTTTVPRLGQVKQSFRTDKSIWEREATASQFWSDWKKTADTAWVGSQITVVNDAINLKVSKGDVMSQINTEAGRVLIQSKKILLNGTNTTITGTSWLEAAVIKDLSVTSAKIANLAVTSAKISALDVSKLSGNKTSFVQSNWNSINNDTLTIDGTALHINNPSQNDKAMLWKGGMTFFFSGTEVGRVGLNYTRQSDQSFLSFSARRGQGMNWAVEAGVNTGLYDTIMEVPRGMSNLRMQSTLDLNAHSITNAVAMYFGTNMELRRINADVLDLRSNKQLRLLANGFTMIDIIRHSSTNTGINVHANLNMQGNTVTGQSDSRLKTNIKDHQESSLQKISEFNFKDFTWIESGKDDFGLIAQEVRHVAPELIIEGMDGYLSLNNSLLNMMTSHGLQELSEKHGNVERIVENHTETIHQLQQELSKANRRIEELESVL